MNSFIYHLLIFVSVSIKSGHGYPYGAPSSTCASMVPQHEVSSQPCSSNYIIESDKVQYSTSDTVHITVRGSTNYDTFRGILLIAKTKTNQKIIGTWSALGSDIQTLNCDRIDNTGITHNSASDKSSIEALWHPPSTIIENSTVIKTVVSSHTSTIPKTSRSTITPTTHRSTTTPTTHRSTTIPKPHHLTTTPKPHHLTTTPKPHHLTTTPKSHHLTTTPKSHHLTTTPKPHHLTTTPKLHHSTITRNTSPSTVIRVTTPATTTSIGPQSNSSGVIINWTYNNGVTSVKMQINNLKTSQWFALGLSLDDDMGEDHVFVCKRSANDQISVVRGINPLGRLSTVLFSTTANLDGTLTPTSLALNNGVTYCEFTLSNFGGSKWRRRDLFPLSQSTTYIPLVALGNLDKSGKFKLYSIKYLLFI
ncbi:unnamed protein product [Rotaria sp. Silwood1]|nr:unnamed protein product [Rotaria sp. Silwood1]